MAYSLNYSVTMLCNSEDVFFRCYIIGEPEKNNSNRQSPPLQLNFVRTLNFSSSIFASRTSVALLRWRRTESSQLSDVASSRIDGPPKIGGNPLIFNPI